MLPWLTNEPVLAMFLALLSIEMYAMHVIMLQL